MSESERKRKYESARQLQRQSDILEAARRMLEQEGYAGVTMRELASEAGVAQATLYNIYGSKDDLILAAIEDLLLGVEATVDASNAADGLDSIIARAEVNARQIQETPRYAEAMARSLVSVQPGDPLVSLLYLRAVPFLCKHLHIAQDRGEIAASHNVGDIAQHLVSQHWGITFQWLMGVIALENLVTERVRSDLITLIAITRNEARQRLEERLAALN